VAARREEAVLTPPKQSFENNFSLVCVAARREEAVWTPKTEL
jgi:hypothetical protein